MKDYQLFLKWGSAGAAQPSQTPTLPRVLVVDDDSDVRQLNTEALLHFGYDVDAAADGADAWQALNDDRFDLLITDHNMPRMTGVDLLKKLRAARMALPVIMATGTVPNEEFIRYPWLLPAAMLLKPYTVTKLLETVEQVLRATDSREQVGPLANCRSQPSAAAFRLF